MSGLLTFSVREDTISTMELSSALWRLSVSAGEYHQYCMGCSVLLMNKSITCKFTTLAIIFLTALINLHITDDILLEYSRYLSHVMNTATMMMIFPHSINDTSPLQY